jgi:hypothetical protein
MIENNLRIQTETHFKDLINIKHLVNDDDRLPGRDGTPGTGLKMAEAMMLAQCWWDTKARKMMPDFGKHPYEQVVKSGIMMGLPWFDLNKQEMLRVVAQWYANIGIHRIIEGRSTSDDNHVKKNMAAIRKDGSNVFQVLSDEGTHAKTNPEDEEKIWSELYKKQDHENIF